MIITLAFLGWLACSAIAAGFWNAYFRGEFPSLNTVKECREHLGVSFVGGLVGGPVSLVLSVFLTGFAMHGWTLSCKPASNDEAAI